MLNFQHLTSHKKYLGKFYKFFRFTCCLNVASFELKTEAHRTLALTLPVYWFK